MPPNRKTLALPALLALRDKARADGRTVVHCHGCFDIVHPGHIHHLQFARSLGDFLVVSVSADTHVNKGVDRPLIPDDLRAASLAALECVDAVYVNTDPTAVGMLQALQPDVYVKGREYERSQDPRFLAERDVVNGYGGRVVYSSGDVVYSSTALIGRLKQADRFQDEKVDRYRERYGLTGPLLEGLLDCARGMRVVVVGDYVLDRYHFCHAGGVAGEGPMLSLQAVERRDFDGGAGVIALHLAGLGASPTLVAALADDDLSRQAEMRLRSGGVEVRCPRVRRDVVRKHRYLAEQTKLFKVDEGAPAPSDSHVEGVLAEQVLAAAEGAAAVIFADFGYGTITAGLLDRVLPHLRRTVPVLAADVSGRQNSLPRFQGFDLLCPTERELRQAQHDFASGLGAVAWNLLNATRARQAIVTLGKQGLVTFDRDGLADADRLRSEHLPALAHDCLDPLGCGDALLAAATLTLATGGSLQAAAYLGALAAAIEVQHVGNQPVTCAQIVERLHQRRPAPAVARLAQPAPRRHAAAGPLISRG